MTIIRQRKPIRQDVATLVELAREGGMDPNKLLACVRETFPQAEMNSPITGGALKLSFNNYEKAHCIGKYKPGDPAPQMQNGAPPAEHPGLTRGNDKMSNDNYDEYGTDKESKRQWENDAGIRTEFHGDYEAFAEFRRAEANGQIKIMGARHV